ncbi:uncharacterized protein FIBRA_00345 [Fibroporia radiculosa]|uniref:F-box domain-containing protein n=1 Tax=Fibroporia radiculosa TaxID=599839 RepID=J7RVE6_9APHY|nr:uncharacterized protein FIBRA_00345 [Fibroporia radiculosa]CCL98350.1 predicted protein [Fibroporia radiculosa]
MAHRALECGDILEEIFSYIHFDGPAYGRIGFGEREICKRTLKSATLVNKTFSNHALNIFWREIRSEAVALSVLPALKFKLVDIQYPKRAGVPSFLEAQEWTYVRIPCRPCSAFSSHDGQVLDGGISAADLDRFRQYAGRVRSVWIVDEETQPDIRFPVIQRLTAQLGGPLFPNLTHLKWNAKNVLSLSANTGRILLCMAGLHLQTLALWPPLWLSETDASRFFLQLSGLAPALALGSPQIQEIEMDNVDWHNRHDIYQTWDPLCAAQFIGAFKLLEKVHVDVHYMNDEVLDALLSLPRLAHLRLCTNCDWDSHTALSDGTHGCFRSLHTLDINSTHSVATSLVQRCEWPALRVLHAAIWKTLPSVRVRRTDYDVSPPLCYIVAFFEVVAATLSPLLDELQVSGHVGCTIPLAHFSISPLRPMHLLRFIELDFLSPSACVGLHDIALNWPDLETFRIHMESQLKHSSLQILLDVASACPRLRVVALNAFALPLGPHLDLHGLVSHDLERIEVSNLEWNNSPNNKVGLLATQVESVFQKLDLEEMMRWALGRSPMERTDWLALLREMNRIRQTKTSLEQAMSDDGAFASV